ncbi:MAG TPA: hypothetical protein VFB54_07620 [Burkholderiales bacterium]|nr:hypothetical protein [Burkholderiales bacterium]
MGTSNLHLRSIVALALSGVALQGCSQLSGSAAMRVDVEVYKGPLSRELSAQVGELCGTLDELDNSLKDYHNGLEMAMLQISHGPNTLSELRKEGASCSFVNKEPAMPAIVGMVPTPAKSATVAWCDKHRTARTQSQHLSCMILALLHDGVEQLHREVEPFLQRRNGSSQAPVTPWMQVKYESDAKSANGNSALCGEKRLQLEGVITGETARQLRQSVQRISELGMHLKLKSMYRAEGDAAFRAQDRLTRAMSTGFANLAAEYSNQLSSRADALLKQLKDDARNLPQSVYLRDSQPTEFVNLYAWNRATTPALLEDMLLHPLESFSAEETANRVRALERLFADAYWSNINTVYASGQGDVSMALVKDDIGNWNLKSFSNDPTDLLAAYKQGGLALIKSAAQMAMSPQQIGAASRVLNFANRLAIGAPKDGDTAVSSDMLARLRDYNIRRLEAVEAKLKTQALPPEEAQSEAVKILDEHQDMLMILAERGKDGAAPSDAGKSGGKVEQTVRDKANGLKQAATVK